MVVFDVDGTAVPVDGTGRWAQKDCVASDGTRRTEGAYLRPRLPLEVRQEAYEHLPLPAPVVELNPPVDAVVNFPSLLGIEASQWQPQESTVSVPGVTVTVRAVPERLIWRLGTGELAGPARRWNGTMATVVCAGPGSHYDPTLPEEEQDFSCSYTWRHSSAGAPNLRLPVEATIEWRVSWEAEGAEGGGDLGLVARTTSTSTRVVEVQTVNF